MGVRPCDLGKCVKQEGRYANCLGHRLGPRKQADRTTMDPAAGKRIWCEVQPWTTSGTTLVSHRHIPVGTDYLLSSIPLILGSTGKVQRNVIHQGAKVLEWTDFFFYSICKVGTKYLSYSPFLDKVAFKSYSPLSFPLAPSLTCTMKIKWDWEWLMLLILMMNATNFCVFWKFFHSHFLCLP